MTPDEKLNQLRAHLEDFITFYNNAVLARNAARDELTARVNNIEAALKRIEDRFEEVLEKASS